MSAAATQMFCACCRGQMTALTSAFSQDLEGFVCPDCRTKLIIADAWLKHANIRGCTKAKGCR